MFTVSYKDDCFEATVYRKERNRFTYKISKDDDTFIGFPSCVTTVLADDIISMAILAIASAHFTATASR